jgi:hypothetical protein
MEREMARFKEQIKPQSVTRGSYLSRGLGDPRPDVDNTYDPAAAYGARGAGGGTRGSSKKNQDPSTMTEFDRGLALLEPGLTKPKGSQTTSGQFFDTHDLYRGIMQSEPNLPGETGARIAQYIAEHPDAVKPGVDYRTGNIGDVYEDRRLQSPFLVSAPLGNGLSIPKGADGKPALTPEQLQQHATRMLGYIERETPGLSGLYKEAATSQEGRTRLNYKLAEVIRDRFATAKGWSALPPERQRALIQAEIERAQPAMQGQLNFLRNYLPKGDGGSGTPDGSASGYGLGGDRLLGLAPTKKQPGEGFGLGRAYLD